MIRALLAVLAALTLASCAAEAQQEEAPSATALELTGRVVDAAEILSPACERRLTERLARLEKETLVQLIVATTPDLGGRDIAAYSLDLVNAWGLGDAQRKDGLLLLVAPNERKVRIEVGRGLEVTVRDEDAAAIIRDAILPHFREGDFEGGVEAGVEDLAHEVAPIPMKEAA